MMKVKVRRSILPEIRKKRKSENEMKPEEGEERMKVKGGRQGEEVGKIE